MNVANQKIIDAVIKKAEKVCPGSLALIGVYGSVCTGEVYEKSDLDLMILINDDAGWQLAEGFILDDTNIGYDLYCTNWQMLEEEACCKHAHLSKLMDSKIVFVADDSAKKKLDAVMLLNGMYFHRGVKRTFEELEQIVLPEGFVNNIYGIVRAQERTEVRESLTGLLASVVDYAKQPREKETPSKGNLSGTYEEMFSNWRNKMYEAADRNDVFSSFMNLSSLQLMIDDIANDISIAEFNVMEGYNPIALKENAALFDAALSRYLHEYEKTGIMPRHFADVDAFVGAYLKN